MNMKKRIQPHTSLFFPLIHLWGMEEVTVGRKTERTPNIYTSNEMRNMFSIKVEKKIKTNLTKILINNNNNNDTPLLYSFNYHHTTSR